MRALDYSPARGLATRLTILLEKGEGALAHRLIDEATLAEYLVPHTPDHDAINGPIRATELFASYVDQLEHAGVRTLQDALRLTPAQIVALDRGARRPMVRAGQGWIASRHRAESSPGIRDDLNERTH